MGVSRAADFARNSILNSIAGATPTPAPPHKGEGEQGSLQGTEGINSLLLAGCENPAPWPGGLDKRLQFQNLHPHPEGQTNGRIQSLG